MRVVPPVVVTRARGALLLASLLASAPALAQPAQSAQPVPPPPACTAPEHRQFDFWLGTWDVTDSTGASMGENVITSEFGGCVVRERWNVGTPFGGESLNGYDRITRRWHQTWMDTRGNVWKTDGGLEGRTMVLTRTGPGPRNPAVTLVHRWTWTPSDEEHVRQLYEVSRDAGKTWSTSFDGRYTKRR